MLKDERLKKGISRKELAQKSGVSERMIAYYETGYKDIKKASVGSVMSLAKVLDVGVEKLI